MKELKIEMNIPIESIEEILITAMEGGSNYWYIMDGEQHCRSWLSEEIKSGRLERNDKIHYKWMDAMFQGCPHKISIYDVEEANEEGEELSELEPLGYLTMDSIAEGLELAQQDYSEEFSQHIPSYNDGDGDSADVLFQLMVMGDVAYG